MKNQDPPEPLSEVDALLRENLRDDLPEDVEARLERRLEAFLVSRQRPAQSGPVFERLWDRLTTVSEVGRRALVGVPASALLVCGIVFHGAAGPAALAESLTQAHVTVAIADAARRASAMTCTGDVLRELRSPGEFAALVYGGWIQRGTARRLDGALYVEFVDPELRLTYELHVNPETMLPGEIRRVPAGATGPPIPALAACSWTGRPVESQPVLEGRER